MNDNSNQSEKRKIAFVCQRYGMDVNGGAEQFCRLTAERLASVFDVTVYTTCAEDYVTWADVFSSGEDTLNGIRILRFPVSRERNPGRFALVNRVVTGLQLHYDFLEKIWIREQGPVCELLTEAVLHDQDDYETIFFVTYLYYTTVSCLMHDVRKAVLIPTLHDEPPVYLHSYDRVFANAKGFVWLTPEERAFAYRRFPGTEDKQSILTGLGIDLPPVQQDLLPPVLRDQPYLVYEGRIDIMKNCDRMFEFFLRYKEDHKEKKLKLALMGKQVCSIPESLDIIYLGFVDEATKAVVLSRARALLLFSHFESLSIAVLESMAVGRPVMVDNHCEVLRGHCDRSGAGFSFTDYGDFEQKLNLLMEDQAAYEAMCKKGTEYINKNYRWDPILRKYCQLIDAIAAEGK